VYKTQVSKRSEHKTQVFLLSCARRSRCHGRTFAFTGSLACASSARSDKIAPDDRSRLASALAAMSARCVGIEKAGFPITLLVVDVFSFSSAMSHDADAARIYSRGTRSGHRPVSAEFVASASGMVELREWRISVNLPDRLDRSRITRGTRRNSRLALFMSDAASRRRQLRRQRTIERIHGLTARRTRLRKTKRRKRRSKGSGSPVRSPGGTGGSTDAIPRCVLAELLPVLAAGPPRERVRESVSETRTRRALDTGALPRGVRVLLAWPLAVVVDVVVYATVAAVVVVVVVVVAAVFVVFVAAAW